MKKRILFLCTGNSCRSQMSEGWLKALGGGRFDALSAGTAPQAVNPFAVKVMSEAGIDISSHRPKLVDEYLDMDIYLLITVCGGAKEVCPAFTGKVLDRIHWPVDDPASATGSNEEILAVFRRTRDEIRQRVVALLKDLQG
ncbi:arsenate reductase ArsC [bacterium]|nr:MAG: arsenate reductase ArsC [bacterium]